MWLFQRTEKKCEDTVYHDLCKDDTIEESIHDLTDVVEEEPTYFERMAELKERIDDVCKMYDDLQDYKIEKNFVGYWGENENVYDQINYIVDPIQYEGTLRIKPVLENSIKPLDKKVYDLPEALDMQQIDFEKAEPSATSSMYDANASEVNIDKSSSQSLTKYKNYERIWNGAIETLKQASTKKKGKVSKGSKKTPKNKKCITKRNKESHETVQIEVDSSESVNKPFECYTSMNESLIHEENMEVVDEAKNANSEQLIESVVAKIKSALSDIKTSRNNEMSEILCKLSKLENEMIINEKNIEILMGKLDHIFSNDNANVCSQSNIKTENNYCQEERKCTQENTDSINEGNQEKFFFGQMRSDKSITANIIVNENNNHNTCELNDCVCRLKGKFNKDTDMVLSEFLKSMHTPKCSAKFDVPCSREKTHDEETQVSIINDQRNCYDSSVCLKKSDCLLDNANENNDELIGIETISRVNCKKSNIYDFLFSQPAPEWINSHKQGEQDSTSKNQCDPMTKPQIDLKKSNIYDFLFSQPAPEWTKSHKQDEQVSTSKNPCDRMIKPQIDLKKSNICDFLLSQPAPEWVKSHKQDEQVSTSKNPCDRMSKPQIDLKKSNICDFLLSQPTPEWIKSLKQDEQVGASKNQCDQIQDDTSAPLKNVETQTSTTFRVNDNTNKRDQLSQTKSEGRVQGKCNESKTLKPCPSLGKSLNPCNDNAESLCEETSRPPKEDSSAPCHKSLKQDEQVGASKNQCDQIQDDTSAPLKNIETQTSTTFRVNDNTNKCDKLSQTKSEDRVQGKCSESKTLKPCPSLGKSLNPCNDNAESLCEKTSRPPKEYSSAPCHSVTSQTNADTEEFECYECDEFQETKSEADIQRTCDKANARPQRPCTGQNPNPCNYASTRTIRTCTGRNPNPCNTADACTKSPCTTENPNPCNTVDKCTKSLCTNPNPCNRNTKNECQKTPRPKADALQCSTQSKANHIYKIERMRKYNSSKGKIVYQVTPDFDKKP